MQPLPTPLLSSLSSSNEIFSLQQLPGNENENYLAQTKDEAFVIKRLLTHSVASTEVEGLYRARVANTGLPVSPYIVLKDNHYVLTVDQDSYVATRYIPGSFATYTKGLAVEVASLLATIHSIDPSGLPERKTWFHKEYIPENLSLISEVYSEDKQAIAAAWTNTPDFWNAGLPTGVVHGDLHNENLIVDSDNKVVSIIDWEEVAIEPLLLDIAYAARAISFRKNICNNAIFSAFMASYQSVRQLTTEERAMFPAALRYTMLTLSVWAHVKRSKQQMDEHLFHDLGERYRLHYDIPEV
jgi:Ser/Thr protein kinase RdoA (MazF antagonist)